MRFILPRLETRTKEFMVDASSRVDKTREMRNESDYIQVWKVRYPSRVTPMCYIFVYFTTPTDVTIDIKDVYITVEALGWKGVTPCVWCFCHIYAVGSVWVVAWTIRPERWWTMPEWGWSQRKLWWRLVAILTCKSFVKLGYRGERLIEPSSSWFPPKFPSG